MASSHTHGHGEHGEHEDGGWHAAEHQAEHRLAEKTGFGLVEHAIDKGGELLAERAAERVAEHAVDHVMTRASEEALSKVAAHGLETVTTRVSENLGERLLERSAEAVGERLAVRGASGITTLGQHQLEKRAQNVANATASHGAAHAAGHAAEQAGGILASGLQALRVLVPSVGLLMVMHMTHEDYHRVHREKHQRGFAFTTLLFIIAFLCDSYDCVVHLCVVTNFTIMHIDHHLLHSMESWSTYAAIGALTSMVAGELLSGRAEAAKSKKE